jgi:hypothetical protein
LFRIVASDPPTLQDFLSDEEAGDPEPDQSDPLRHRLWQGRSAYNTEAQARRKARGFPLLGAYIAEVRLPDDPAISYERTTKSMGHFTIWGDARHLMRCVVRIVPV